MDRETGSKAPRKAGSGGKDRSRPAAKSKPTRKRGQGSAGEPAATLQSSGASKRTRTGKPKSAQGKGVDTAQPRTNKQRRSFSQKTLAVESEGPLGAELGDALRAAGASGYSLTHAFHPYPGRFHPFLVSKILGAVAPSLKAGSLKTEALKTGSGGLVLDPFMGGGTTLVEAMRLGLATVGNDLNPVARLVARERTRPRTADEARLVEVEFGRLAAQVEGLRREKNPPRLDNPNLHRIMPHYQRHLLAEMLQWIRLIDTLREPDLRDTLRAVFSAAVVKFSNLTSDSRQVSAEPPRYPKGAVSRFLVMKGRQLAQSQATLAAHIPPGTPAPQLLSEDARLLSSLAWDACDLVVTSPPYPGTYDYHEHHRLRLDWLDLDGTPLARGELTPGRERPDEGERAPESWSAGFKDVLSTLARVLRPRGQVFLVLGDWISGGHAVNAGGLLTRIAKEAGWKLVSKAAAQREAHSPQERKAFTRKGKWEHLLHFERESFGIESTVDRKDAAPRAVGQKPAGVSTTKVENDKVIAPKNDASPPKTSSRKAGSPQEDPRKRKIRKKETRSVETAVIETKEDETTKAEMTRMEAPPKSSAHEQRHARRRMVYLNKSAAASAPQPEESQTSEPQDAEAQPPVSQSLVPPTTVSSTPVAETPPKPVVSQKVVEKPVAPPVRTARKPIPKLPVSKPPEPRKPIPKPPEEDIPEELPATAKRVVRNRKK